MVSGKPVVSNYCGQQALVPPNMQRNQNRGWYVLWQMCEQLLDGRHASTGCADDHDRETAPSLLVHAEGTSGLPPRSYVCSSTLPAQVKPLPPQAAMLRGRGAPLAA